MPPKERIFNLTDPSDFFMKEDYEKAVHNFLVILRMVKRFLKTGNINEKLLINDVIIAINFFGAKKVNIILREILNNKEFGVIKSILLFLKTCYPPVTDNVKSNRIIDDILKDTKQRYNLC